jgi:hypothetical protein
MSFDRYTDVVSLGATEAGILYRAVDPVLGRTVLLRALPAGPYEPPEVEHPCVVNVLGSFEEEFRRVLVEEWVDGRSLEELMEEGVESIPMARRIEWLRCLAGALVTAHRAGFVHGALSAAWVIVPDDDGPLRLAGLGVARPFGGTDPDPADDAADIGLLARDLLSGPGVPPDVARAIQSCLAADEDRRLDALADLALGESQAAMFGGGPRAVPDPAPQPRLDENVQFTVYRPRAVASETWSRLLFFAHLDALPGDADRDESDPLEQVEETARRELGDEVRSFRETVQDSLAALPQEGEVTVVPEMDGVRFSPASVTFLWLDSVHWHEFRMKAAARLSGSTARGRITVRHGAILLAEIPVSFAVDRPGAVERPADSLPSERETARAYRSIFPSYSHRDTGLVEQFVEYGRSLGDTYLQDVLTLRSGEVWNDRLKELIEQADVFQLFWSTNAMASQVVEQEWQHALKLQRPHFVRPTYWERPLPEVSSPELRRLHFHFLGQESEDPFEEAQATQSSEPTDSDEEQPYPLPEERPPAMPEVMERSTGNRGRGWAMAASVVLMLGLGWLVVPQLFETPAPDDTGGTIELASTSPDGEGGEVRVGTPRSSDGEEQLAVSIPVRTERSGQSLRWTRPEVEAIARRLQEAPPDAVVEIRGMAGVDEAGEEEAAVRARVRADRVRDQLLEMGIPPERLRVVDCGREESPVCADDLGVLGGETVDDQVLILTRTAEPARDAEQLEIDLEAVDRVRSNRRLRSEPQRRPPG